MKQWLSDFKLALIQEDVNKLENLLDELDMKAFIKNLAKESPSEDFLKENANDVFYQVQALLQEAVILIEQKKKQKLLKFKNFKKR
ncbi:hypothetical protein CJD42_2620 [Campylobacter jejuni subsp. jejuni D42a]|nr:hypothetical protein CJD42_2620 [Campylobacter jejuni subsp. jejuni D42a]ERF99594.1 hypothetical protein D272_05662 [Campylobacter coli CVM N29716]